MRIEAALERDIEVILEMIRGLAEYERLSGHVTATPQLLRENLFGPKAFAEVLLTYNESECIGFALFFPNFSTFLGRPGLFLEDLYVKPEWRGKGAGTALLREVAQIACARGCGRVEWDVLDWNEPSIGFYKKLGAAPMDDWTRYRLTGEALLKLGAPEK
ncbi:MAG: GNAT family N-acetyltransferase [Terriglobia bacterium]